MKRSTGAVLVFAPILVSMLAGCTPTVALTAAADATNPGCAEIIVRLPKTVANQAIRETDAQATAAWGSPTSVILHCGVTPPGPTTEVCDSVSGIDWLRDASKAPIYVFTTYGRSPATEVIVDSKLTNGQGTIILDELSNAIGSLPQKHKCLKSEDVLGSPGLPTAAPSAQPTAAPTAAPTP